MFLEQFLLYLAKEVEQSFMKQKFLVNKRKRLTTISETKPNTVHLTINYFTVFKATTPRSEPIFVTRIGLPDFADLGFVDFV